MDPDENLRQQLQLAGAIIHLADEDYDATDDAVHLAELVQAMNDWIQRGGFLPEQWEPARTPAELARSQRRLKHVRALRARKRKLRGR